MSKSSSLIIKNKANLGAAGGAAGGTGLLGIIDSLAIPPEHKHIAILLTPWISLVLMFLLNWLIRKYKIRQLYQNLNQGELILDEILEKARLSRDEILGDEHSTEEEKKKRVSTMLQCKKVNINCGKKP